MLVTPCPRCHESVRIPDRLLSGQVAATAQVQCPWCLSTLDQQEIESAMPPALIVVGDDLNTGADPLADLEPVDVDDEEPAASAGFALAGAAPGLEASSLEAPSLETLEPEPEAADTTEEVGELETLDSDVFESPTDEHELTSVEPSADADDLDEFTIPEDQSDSAVEAEPEVAPMAIYTSDKKRRKKKSLIKTVGSPILGALLALPVGGGLLWYLDALPNLGFYPLDGTYSSSNQVQRSAAAPVNPGGYVPPIMDDAPEGRSLGEELNNDSSDDTSTPPPVEIDTSEADMVPATDPATDVLAELSDLTTSSNKPAAENDLETPPEDLQPLPSDEPSVTEVAKPPVESIATSEEGAPMDAPATTDEAPTAEEPQDRLPGLPPAIDEVASDDTEMPATPEATASNDSKADMTDAIDEIDMVLNQLEGIDAADPKYGQAVIFAYGMLSRLSAETSPGNYDQLQPLVDRIKSNKNLFISFAKQVPAWIDTPQEDRQTDGAFILGKFVDAEESDGYQVRLMNGKAYPVTFADSVDAQTVTAVAFGNLDVAQEPASFEINWMQPAQ